MLRLFGAGDSEMRSTASVSCIFGSANVRVLLAAEKYCQERLLLDSEN